MPSPRLLINLLKGFRKAKGTGALGKKAPKKIPYQRWIEKGELKQVKALEKELSFIPEKYGFKVLRKSVTDFFPGLKHSRLAKGEQRVSIVKGVRAPITSIDESGNITINLSQLKEGTDIVDIVLGKKATSDIRFRYALLHELDHRIAQIEGQKLPALEISHFSKLADDYLRIVKSEKTEIPYRKWTESLQGDKP